MPQTIKSLPLGAKVKFGRHSVNGEAPWDIEWLVVAKNHTSSASVYPTNSVTLLTEKIIDLRAFDAAHSNPSIPADASYGSAKYRTSNLHQWLNSDKGAGEWYTQTTVGDNPPKSGKNSYGTEYVIHNTPYYDRPGFLNSFTGGEKNAILTTEIASRSDNATAAYNNSAIFVTTSCKVFLPCIKDLVSTNEEVWYWHEKQWAYFSGARPFNANVDARAYANSTTNGTRASAVTDGWIYWTRGSNEPADITEPTRLPIVTETGNFTNSFDYKPHSGGFGVRPALNINADTLVSDTTDGDGCYVAILNNAPDVPAAISVPTIVSGVSNNISWEASTDPEGDSVAYELDCSYDGGGFTTIYNGANLSYSHLVPYGSTSVQYRVRAYDTNGGYSGYRTSDVVAVVNNSAPTISGTDGNLGTKTDGFTQTYTITDADGDSVTVTEAVDGIAFNSYAATLGDTNTCNVTGTAWLRLGNGSHELTITATDAFGLSSVRTYSFVKSVDSCSILTNPMESGAMPTRIFMSISKSIPEAAEFKVEVCNNAHDAEPTWEDATSAVNSSLVHVFGNTSKTADRWGVMVRVTINRHGAEGACYISAIGGNFE